MELFRFSTFGKVSWASQPFRGLSSKVRQSGICSSVNEPKNNSIRFYDWTPNLRCCSGFKVSMQWLQLSTCRYVCINFTIIKNSENTNRKNRSVRNYILKHLAKREAIRKRIDSRDDLKRSKMVLTSINNREWKDCD